MRVRGACTLAVFLAGCGGLIGSEAQRPPGPPGTDVDPSLPPPVTGTGEGGKVTPADAYNAFLEVWGALNPTPGRPTACATCHSGRGPGHPDHSADDAMRAYEAALTVVDLASPASSLLYVQARSHVPSNGDVKLSEDDRQKILVWVVSERAARNVTPGMNGMPPPEPRPEDLIAARKAEYALALDSVALRVAQVPASLAELADIDAQPDDAARRARYEQYVAAYLAPRASEIEGPLALGHKRPGVVENVFYNPDLLPGFPDGPRPPEGSDRLSLTSLDFDRSANRGGFIVYPSALSRLALQWLGFGGIRSSRDNATVENQDNYGAMDALLRNILEDRPIREAFQTTFTDAEGQRRETRACLHVPFAGYQVPVLQRQVCRRNGEVDDARPSGEPVPGGILTSRSFQRVNYGHYKFHTLRTAFKSFHCKDFPVFTNNIVNGADDAASRARVVSPWSDTGTTPYCASCHANSNMNVMALTFWRFDDASGVLRDRYVAHRPTEDYVRGPQDIVSASVDATKYYYKDQVLPSLDAWVQAFVDDPDFTRCSAAQIYNFAMGRGNASTKEHVVPVEKMDELVAAYEAAYGAGSARDMTALKMLAVVFQRPEFTQRAAPLEKDPCPEVPNGARGCEAMVSARRISWFGYLARWMRIFETFAVQRSTPGGYTRFAADTFGFGVTHPDRGLAPLVEPATPESQYVALHKLLGEPLDNLGDEPTTIVAFRAQHTLHQSAGAVKQACRISISLTGRLADRLSQGNVDAAHLAAIDTVVEAEHGPAPSAITRIRGFKPEIGYLAYGRKLGPAELAAVNAELGAGASPGDGWMSFRRALAGLLCSTSALVE